MLVVNPPIHTLGPTSTPTPSHRRPLELLINEAVYGPTVDIWSAGCIFAEMLCGKPLFPGKDDIEQIKRILEVLGKPSPQEAPSLAALPGYVCCCTCPFFSRCCVCFGVMRTHAHACLECASSSRPCCPSTIRPTATPPTNAHHPRYRTLADVKGIGLREKLMRNCATEEHRRKITPKAVDLLARMLCLDPDRRIDARDAIMHEYFYEEPMACEPSELPKFAASHEMTMKAKRKADKEAGRGQDHKRGRYDGGGHHDTRCVVGCVGGYSSTIPMTQQATVSRRWPAGGTGAARTPTGAAGPLPRTHRRRRAPQARRWTLPPRPAPTGACEGRRAGCASAGAGTPWGATWRLPTSGGGVWGRLWCAAVCLPS